MTGFSALLLFAALTLLLMLLYTLGRLPPVLMGKKPANSWTRGMPNDDGAFALRAQHAHANALESLPVFAVIVLVAAAMGKAAVVDQVACWIIAARVGQSAIHLAGTSHWLVFIRANLFLVQIGLFGYCLFKLLA